MGRPGRWPRVGGSAYNPAPWLVPHMLPPRAALATWWAPSWLCWRWPTPCCGSSSRAGWRTRSPPGSPGFLPPAGPPLPARSPVPAGQRKPPSRCGTSWFPAPTDDLPGGLTWRADRLRLAIAVTDPRLVRLTAAAAQHLNSAHWRKSASPATAWKRPCRSPVPPRPSLTGKNVTRRAARRRGPHRHPRRPRSGRPGRGTRRLRPGRHRQRRSHRAAETGRRHLGARRPHRLGVVRRRPDRPGAGRNRPHDPRHRLARRRRQTRPAAASPWAGGRSGCPATALSRSMPTCSPRARPLPAWSASTPRSTRSPAAACSPHAWPWRPRACSASWPGRRQAAARPRWRCR